MSLLTGLLVLSNLFHRATACAGNGSEVPRALLVFAHPDDEVIALGARLPRFTGAHLVHVTDGAPANLQESIAHGFTSIAEYRRARQDELAEALRLGGLEHVSRECLGYSDQGVSLRLVQLTHDILRRMESCAPEVVFTHPYEGGHPDHDACAFAVHHAASLYAQDGGAMPLTIEAAFYHLGPRGIQTNEFLPLQQSPECADYPLSEEERQRKQKLLFCFRTQQATLRYFHIDVERFRVAPNYDFTKPPHNPPVFYDHYGWGISSARFCELAQQAALGIQREKAGSCL